MTEEIRRRRALRDLGRASVRQDVRWTLDTLRGLLRARRGAVGDMPRIIDDAIEDNIALLSAR